MLSKPAQRMDEHVQEAYGHNEHENNDANNLMRAVQVYAVDLVDGYRCERHCNSRQDDRSDDLYPLSLSQPPLSYILSTTHSVHRHPMLP